MSSASRPAARPAPIEILKQGRSIASSPPSPSRSRSNPRSEPVEIWNPDKYLPLPGQCYYAMADTLEARGPMSPCVSSRRSNPPIDEIMAEPLAPLIKRAAKDFDIPGATERALQTAIVQRTVPEIWMSEGKENFLKNVPRLWSEGVEALRIAKIVDLKDPTVLYTNKFIDEALAMK